MVIRNKIFKWLFKIEWVIALGACYHATPKYDIFSKYNSGKFVKLKMNSTSHANITGIGTIRIQTYSNCILTLKDLRYMSNISLNLLFAYALDLEGYQSYISG